MIVINGRLARGGILRTRWVTRARSMRYINIGQMFGVFRWCDWCDMDAGWIVLIVVGVIVIVVCGCCIAITYARVAEEKSRKAEDRAKDAELAAAEESRRARLAGMPDNVTPQFVTVMVQPQR